MQDTCKISSKLASQFKQLQKQQVMLMKGLLILSLLASSLPRFGCMFSGSREALACPKDTSHQYSCYSNIVNTAITWHFLCANSQPPAYTPSNSRARSLNYTCRDISGNIIGNYSLVFTYQANEGGTTSNLSLSVVNMTTDWLRIGCNDLSDYKYLYITTGKECQWRSDS